MEADNSAQGLINLPQAVQRTPPRELQEEITTPTTTIPVPKIHPRSFIAPDGTILNGKRLDVHKGTEMHFRTPDVIPKGLLDLMKTQNAESW
jgi:hypothetical protein